MNQHEFVLGCQKCYAENYYEPGNPEDGEWHDCHYPVPKCLGGTETVKLLKEHHAVQGVLQSEEFNVCCIWSWEKQYLTGEYLDLCLKWLSAKGRSSMVKVNERYTSEERTEMAKRRWDKFTPEERSERGRNANNQRKPENRVKSAQLAGRASVDNRTPEQRSDAIKRGWKSRRSNGKRAATDGKINIQVNTGLGEALPDGFRWGRIITRTKRTCPHCSTTGRGPNMTRYHFDNCKNRVGG